MIPLFPEFAPIALEQKPEVDAVLARLRPQASEYTFTNLFGWGQVCGYALARFGDGLLVCKQQDGKAVFLQPLVSAGGAEAVATCLSFDRGTRIERVGEDFLSGADLRGMAIEVQEDRNNFDYVYSVPELIDLRGEKYHDKKNLLNQFVKNHPQYAFLPMTPDIVERCLGFQHEWCEERECEKNPGLFNEHCATHRMLRHFAELRLHGGVIEIDGRIAALTIGEPLRADTYVIHIEKGMGKISGIYQAINHDFLRHAVAGFPYVNREQDLGIPGLRKAKMTYNPVRMVKKYVITGGK